MCYVNVFKQSQKIITEKKSQKPLNERVFEGAAVVHSELIFFFLDIGIYLSRLMTKQTKWHVRPSAQSDQNLHCPHEESLGP